LRARWFGIGEIMRIQLILYSFALLGAACATSQPPVSADICQDSRIVDHMRNSAPGLSPAKPECISATQRYRDNGKIVDVPVARVFDGWEVSYDVVEQRWTFFVRLPDGDLARLGAFWPAVNQGFEATLYAREVTVLKNECPDSRCESDGAALFLPVLEKRIRRLCMTYDMKPPYTGSFYECADRKVIPGNIELAGSALDWSAASDIACMAVFTEVGVGCSSWYSSIARELRDEPDGILAYYIHITLGPDIPDTNCRAYQYRVGPMDGIATLIEKSRCPS
jgi:hypothetical protein